MKDDTNKTGLPSETPNLEGCLRKFLEYTDKYPEDAWLVERFFNILTEFKENFRLGTLTTDSFLSISEMEGLILKLNGEQRALGFELLANEINKIDETALVEKKNLSTVKTK